MQRLFQRNSCIILGYNLLKMFLKKGIVMIQDGYKIDMKKYAEQVNNYKKIMEKYNGKQ